MKRSSRNFTAILLTQTTSFLHGVYTVSNPRLRLLLTPTLRLDQQRYSKTQASWRAYTRERARSSERLPIYRKRWPRSTCLILPPSPAWASRGRRTRGRTTSTIRLVTWISMNQKVRCAVLSHLDLTFPSVSPSCWRRCGGAQLN